MRRLAVISGAFEPFCRRVWECSLRSTLQNCSSVRASVTQSIDLPGPSAVVEPELASLLPAIYSDGRAATAVYSISPDRARAAVKPHELHPIELPGRRSIAVVSSFDYVETTLGPYRELAIGVVVSPNKHLGPPRGLDLLKPHPETGAWLLALPVSSKLACRGGVELFGYPKTECDLHVEHSSRKCVCLVEENSREIFKATFGLGWGPQFPVRSFVTYTEKGGRLLRTRVETQWRVTLCSGRGTTLEVANSSHPVCQAVQQLSLPNKPLFVLHGNQFRAILSAGTPL